MNEFLQNEQNILIIIALTLHFVCCFIIVDAIEDNKPDRYRVYICLDCAVLLSFVGHCMSISTWQQTCQIVCTYTL